LATSSLMQLPEIPKLGGGEAQVSSPAQISRIAWNIGYYNGLPKVDGVWITFADALPQSAELFVDLLNNHGQVVSSGGETLTSELPANTPVLVSTTPPASSSSIYKVRLVVSASIESAEVSFNVEGLSSDASGDILTVDSTGYAFTDMPKAFTWLVSSSHTFEWTETVGASSGKRYVWTSTRGLSTERSGSIVVPSGGGSVTATYKTQYSLTVSVSGSGTTTPAPGTYWYDSGAQVQVTATPNQGYIFSYWLLDGNNAGSNNPITVQMNSAHTLTAVFTQIHTEERCFGYHTQTVNGLTAIRLITGPDVSYRVEENEATVDRAITIQWGIRVWKRSSAGTETEITAGTPVALVSRNNNGQGIQSATWSCPEVSLSPTDSIVVRVYMDFEGWRLLQEFTTEQLGAQKLVSSPWTVYYYTYYNLRLVGGVEGDLVLTARFYHGNSGYPSRIAGFKWG
jgi:hypothetical protein